MMKRLVILLMAVVGAACGDSSVDPPTAMNPTVQPIPDQAVPWEGVSIELLDYFDDADGDPLTFTVQNGNSNIKDELHALSTLVLTPIDIGIRSGAITVIAADPSGASISTVFTAVTILAFREDWDDPDALDEWDFYEAKRDGSYNEAHVEVRDGMVYLYPADQEPIQHTLSILKNIDRIESNWVIKVRAGLWSSNPLADACTGIAFLTDDPLYSGLVIGMGYTGGWEMAAVMNHGDYVDWHWMEMWEEAVWSSPRPGEVGEVTVSLIDGILSIIAEEADTVVSFNPLRLLERGGSTPDFPWPPDKFPANLVGIELANIWWCGDKPVYPPNRGRDREDRNNIRIDWVEVTAGGVG